MDIFGVITKLDDTMHFRVFFLKVKVFLVFMEDIFGGIFGIYGGYLLGC